MKDEQKSETPAESGGESLPARLTARHGLFAVPVVVALVYVACTFLWNTPGSPVKTSSQGVLDTVMKPYFVQTWTLFAPNPPTFNVTGWYQVRYTENGVSKETPVYSLTDPYQQSTRRIPLLWPLVSREVDRLGTQLEQVTVARSKRTAEPPDGPNVSAPAVGRLSLSPVTVDKEWANDLYEAEHIASSMADGLGLARTATQVRVFYTTAGLAAPTASSPPNPVSVNPVQVADTGWVPYLPEARR